MRDFTPEEKELIANTPITKDCFDMTGFNNLTARNLDDERVMPLDYYWEGISAFFDILRECYVRTKDERYFAELVRLLPNSYKVVKV